MAQHLASELPTSDRWVSILEDLTGLERGHATSLVSCCMTIATSDGREARLPPGTALLTVESGTVLLTAREPAGRSPILAFGRGGDLLIPPIDRETLVGLGRGSIRILTNQTLHELLSIGGVGARLVERLGAVIRDRQESLRLAIVSPHRERVRQKLLQLARSHGRVRTEGVRIALPLTHELLARAVGASRETVTLAMRELRDEGFLARSGRSYVIRIHPHELDRREATPAAA